MSSVHFDRSTRPEGNPSTRISLHSESLSEETHDDDREASSPRRTKARTGGFDRFDFDPKIAKGIRDAGFQEPRPIQAAALPAALEGRDVLGLAQTGTGKTAAFALPILDYLLEEPGAGPRALVLAPTRELATQIHAEIGELGRHTGIRSTTIFGGVSPRTQIAALGKRPEIVVGCPGRVLDLMNQGRLKLDDIEILVLDEADHMFDMGFLPDIRRILKALPRDRQNLLFSATMPREIRGLADDLLHDAKVVELADGAPSETIEHALYPIAEGSKRELLDHLLDADDCETAIVFTRTKHRARRLAKQLTAAGRRAVGLQGNMSQPQRERAMSGFRARKFDILVATDIAARGIDVSGVSHVINYDVPNTPAAYTHRIGRTGRSECEGKACTFVTSDDGAWIKATERELGSKIPRVEVAGFSAAPSREPGSSRSASRSRTSRSTRGRGSKEARASEGSAKERNGSRSSGRRRRSRRGGGPRGSAGPRATAR